MYFLEAKVPKSVQFYENHHLFDENGEELPIPLVPNTCLSTTWQPLACSQHKKPLEHLQLKYTETSICTRIISEEN